MALNLGTLEQVIRDVGGDEVLRKMGLIDAAAAKLGARPITIGLTAPGVPAVTQGLTNVSKSITEGVQALTLLRTQQTAATAGASTMAAGAKQVADATQAQEQAASAAAEQINKQAAATKRLSEAEKEELAAAKASRANRGAAAPGQLGDASIAAGASRFDAMFPQFAAGAGKAAVENEKLAASHQKAAAAAGQQDAALQKTTQRASMFGRELTKGDGQLTAFSRRGVTALNGIAFGFTQMANTGEASLRSIAGAATSVLSFMGPKGAIAAIGATIGLGAFDIVRANQKRILELRATAGTAAARDELAQRKAQLDALDAVEKAAYDRGLQSLTQFYSDRARIINERAAAEVRSREQQADILERKARDLEDFTKVAGRDVLPDWLRSANIQQVEELRIQARSLRTEAQAAATQGATEQTRNTAEREAAERQLQQQMLDFQIRFRQAQGDTHAARLLEIQKEGQEFARVNAQRGVGMSGFIGQAIFIGQQRQNALFQRAETDYARLQEDLANRRLDVQTRLNQRKITQLQADKEIADIERSSVPTLSSILDLMERFAGKNEEALATVRRLRAELKGLGVDVLTPFQQSVLGLRNTVSETFGQMGLAAANSFGSALAVGLSSAWTKDSGKNFFEGFGNALLQGLGGAFVQLGSSLMAYGAIMLAAPALAALFPALTISAGQALAAGAALVALGAGMGAIASNNSGRRTGGGSTAAFTGGNQDTVKHIWLDPDRRRETERATAAVRSPNAAVTPLPVVQVNQNFMGENDPRLHGWISRQTVAAVRAGYPIGSA